MITAAGRRSRWLASAAAGSLLLALGGRAAAQSAEAQREFLRGLTALHEFEYEDANEAFRQAEKLDAGVVMAYWGEAMTYHQTLWRRENLDAAQQALRRLAPTPAARAAKARTSKEREYLAAVEILFGRGDAPTRHRDYAAAMERLYAQYPDDPDVASFYALSLLGTTSRSLIGASDVHEGHSRELAGSEIQSRVAAVLENVLKSHPDHRGALHYLLHDYDNPEHARLALAAARAYAKIDPESSHARHMPSHIFLQLGMWHDAALSDRSAFAASDAWVTRKGMGAAMRNYHALSWLQYELLQLGRYREAWETLGQLEPAVKASGQTSLLSDLSSMRARYVIETRQWNRMAGERNFGNVNELFAIGMSAARAGSAPLAEMARAGLAARTQDEREGDLRPAIAIMEREIAALLELAAGRHREAVGILQAAAQAELELPAPLGLPAPIKPAPELLGEILLEAGAPHDAIAAFDQALRRNANRSLSVLGLARAAIALGQTDAARQRYRMLLANFDRADADLPELAEARTALQRADAPTSRVSSSALVWLMVVGAGAVALLVVARRSARRRAAVDSRGGRRKRQG